MTTKKSRHSKHVALLPYVMSFVILGIGNAQSRDAEEEGFLNPPNSSRPLVWWHWMNGNITKEGIADDLDWMVRVGVGGLQNFDANLATPQIVDNRLVYMTPEWKDAFRFAVEQAEQRHLQFAIASSPGWSETGGPWVKPKDGVKKVVWTDTLIEGGKPFKGRLPPVPSATGPYQSIEGPIGFEARYHTEHTEQPSFSADVAVFAYPAKERPLAKAQYFVNDVSVNGAPLVDDNYDSVVDLPRGSVDHPSAIRVQYASPQTVRSATIYLKVPIWSPVPGDAVQLLLQSSDDGRIWTEIARLRPEQVPTTLSFPPVTARQFRLVLEPTASTGVGSLALSYPAPGVDIPKMLSSYVRTPAANPTLADSVAEFHLSAESKVDRFEEKAGFSVARDYYALDADETSRDAGVPVEQVIDLSSRIKPDGTLEWTPPTGRWHVIRLGYSLTGKTNHPATAEATGLEVDKLDANAVRSYLETYLGMYRDAVGPDLIGHRGIRAFLTDSTEVSAFNWTPKFIEQFRRLRHYDPRPWLPTLTGALIGTRQQSNDFLYDFRRTLAELHASEHYGTVAAFAHSQGLILYGEALENNRPSMGDDMAMRAYTDVPMAAMWTYDRSRGPRATFLADIKGAASVAHIYGQNLVAAESMTSAMSPWAFAPADLKRIIDLEFALGVNRPVIHTSVHQPADDKLPGLSLAIFGQYFNRHETWAEMARPWVDYISRSAFLLQQGRYVADVAYFYGEEAPLTGLYGEKPVADAPTHYAYDFVNAEALMTRLSVEQGVLSAASGARYRILYLGGSSHKMTLAVLRRLRELADAGATIVGLPPDKSPSLDEDTAEYHDLVKQLWNGSPVTFLGRGRVIASNSVEAALQTMNIGPDFDSTALSDGADVLFLHRRTDDDDIYFVSNRSNHAQRFDARFRVSGRAPEIWRAESGTTESVSYRIEGDYTSVPLDMLADDAVFFVFRKAATTAALAIKPPKFTTVAELGGAWDVSFQSDRGAPATAHFDSLRPLDQNADGGIKYFSGISTYTKRFSLPKGGRRHGNLLLDLGNVGDVAEVRLNGHLIGTAWHAPYQVVIGDELQPGMNILEVGVANLWVNRLIGDAQPGATKVAWTSTATYRADAPLRPAGLIGPVRVLSKED